MTHTVQFTAHSEGYIAWVNGRRMGWLRRELRRHPRHRAGPGTPDAWRCWRLYRHGAPYTTGTSRRDAALAAWDRLNERRTPA